MSLDVLKTKMHDLMDPLWQQGVMTREALYKELSEVIGREAHVSEMTKEEIKKCALHVRKLRAATFPCYKCRHNITEADGFPICRKQENMEGVCCGSFEVNEYA